MEDEVSEVDDLGDIDLLDIKDRKAIALAVLAEAKAQRLMGNLIAMDLVVEIIYDVFSTVQAYLASLGTNLANDLALMDDPRQIDNHIHSNVIKFIQGNLDKNNVKETIKSLVLVREERIKKRSGKI